jgi:branched-chain amino acid aminotransferase
MLDWKGDLSESTGANVFLVIDGKLVTPTPENFLDGITRRAVMGLAGKRGWSVEERAVIPEELDEASEVFLCGTAAEIVPVREIDDISLGPPGELTTAIQKRFFEAIKGQREEYLEWLDIVEVERGPVPKEQVGTA